MIIFCGSQAQISAKETKFAPKISSDIWSAAGEPFIGPCQSLPQMSDGPTAIGEHCNLSIYAVEMVFETIFHGNGRNMTYEKEFHY